VEPRTFTGFVSPVGSGSAFYVRPKLRAFDGVEPLTMKKQISGFILGTLLACAIIFTIAADNRHPAAWDYKVVDKELQYNQHDYYSEARRF